MAGHTDKVKGLSFSSDSQVFASSSEDNTIRFWRLQDGATIATLRGHGASIHGLQISPDSHRLVSASFDHTGMLWKLDDLYNLNRLRAQGCDWLRSYLTHNPHVTQRDKQLCKDLLN
jgi:WD40 repeat protein